MVDSRSVARTNTAHPLLRAELLAILKEAQAALTGRAWLRFSYVMRTPAEQNALYAQSRRPVAEVNQLRAEAGMPPISAQENRLKVTNAAAWQSYHNFGLAVDIVLIIDGAKASWDRLSDYDGDRVSDWIEVVHIFKKHGWEWGGEWASLKDYPHFQKDFGLSLKELNARRINRQLTTEHYVDVS